MRTVKLYPTSAESPLEAFHFPEQSNSRFRKMAAVAISGGSMRSFSAAIGQLSGLLKLDCLKHVGALSTLSGSSWFGALYNYIPTSISDISMLGEVTTCPPSQLSLESLGRMDPNFIGYPIPKLTNLEMVETIHQLHKNGVPLNRRFAQTLGKILLDHFNLYDPNQYFSLNNETVNNLIVHNPQMTSEQFVCMRPERPYFIASATIVDIDDHNKTMHHFEYSPLYAGTGQTTATLGGGYVQSIGFNTPNPIEISSDNMAEIPNPEYAFTLFDLMGSSGAAPGIIFDKLHIPQLLPEYHYWPVHSPTGIPARLYSFADGGDLEDTAIIPLLRRQFPMIIAFINSGYPIGSTSRHCRDGIDGSLGRLFGQYPENMFPNHQKTQVFSNAIQNSKTDRTPFQRLVDGLIKTKAEHNVPYHMDEYSILPKNPFGVEPYQVKIMWVYNQMNTDWRQQLPKSISKLFSQKHNHHHLHNFPNYKTILQNGLEVFSLSAEQIQLLANMWHYSLRPDGTVGKSIQRFITND